MVRRAITAYMTYQFECSDPECEFLVRSPSDEEVARLVRAHAREFHRGRFAPVDIKQGIRQIDSA